MWRFVSCIAVATLSARMCTAFTPSRNGWGMTSSRVATKVSSSSTQLPFTVPPEAEEMLASLAAAATDKDETVLESSVRESFDRLGQREMMALSARASGSEAAKTASKVEKAASPKEWAQVLDAIERETHRRMSAAKERLEKLMEAGEINELDKRLSKMVRNSEIDPAFLTVLNTNLEAAKAKEEATSADDAGAAAAVSLANVYQHISSRVQEELEKKASPEFALLHKLMRTDDAGLRERILGHYLKPQREILMPDTTVIPLDTPKPSRVAPMAFSGAVQQLVTTLRSLDVNGDTVVETIESAREVAKEARRIIEADELYGPEVLDEFTESLMGTFGGGRG